MKNLCGPLTSAAALLLAVGLTGCGDGPTAQEVMLEHQDEAGSAVTAVETELQRLDGIGDVLGSATTTRCETGQHNYKVDDPYDVRCTVEVDRAYLVRGTDFRAAADTVTATFPECGPDSAAETTLRDYWDTLEGSQTHNFDGPYRPDYLPGYALGCAQGATAQGAPKKATALGVTGWVSLPVDEESADLHQSSLGGPCTSTEDTPCEGTGDSFEEVLASAQGEQGWILFVSGTQEFVRTP